MPERLQAADLSSYLDTVSQAEREFRKLFQSNAPLVVFDVGACEGEDSVRYARRFPQARIFAFEPLPANQAVVRSNFVRYAIYNAELVPFALSDRAGKATFFVSSGRPSELFAGENWNYGNKSSSLLAPAHAGPMHGWIEFKETITVSTETLDRFCREREIAEIHFLHLDVQGAEQLVLKGAAEMLPRIHAIWLEVANTVLYHGQVLRTEIERSLADRGFSMALYEDRGDEGDQLYVNRRFASGRRYLTGIALWRAGRRIRRTLAKVKRVLWSRLPP